MNAVMHRDYASTAPLRITWLDDRLEIQSPGGLYGEASPENFPRQTSYRNPVVAEALNALGYVNRYGRGVLRAQAALEKNGSPIDVGPNLGAINRAALIASRHVVIPLGPDLFSLQGLRNLGPSLRAWRASWQELAGKNPDAELVMPDGKIEPLGYVVMQHGVRGSLPPKAYQRWIDRFPAEYRESVLDESPSQPIKAEGDPYCLAMLKHYRSLMPMAMEARKPVFALKPADGAIGAHTQAVRNAYGDFLALGRRIGDRCGAVIS